MKLAALVALPLALLWIVRDLYIEQVGPLVVGADVSHVDAPIDLLAFERDGQHLWCVTARDVQQWDVKTKRRLHTHLLGEQHSFPPPSSPFLSADGQTLLTSDRDKRDCFYVKMWDVHTGRLERSLRVSGSMQYQRNAALSPNGILATNNWPTPGQDARGMYFGEQVKIWKAKTGALSKLISLPGPSSQGSATISCLALSNDGTLVVAGLQEGDIWVWDARSGRELGKWKDGSADILVSKSTNSSFSVVPGVYLVALSPNGQVLATASGDDTVRLWQPRTGKLLHIIKTPTGQEHPPLLFSPDLWEAPTWMDACGMSKPECFMRDLKAMALRSGRSPLHQTVFFWRVAIATVLSRCGQQDETEEALFAQGHTISEALGKLHELVQTLA